MSLYSIHNSVGTSHSQFNASQVGSTQVPDFPVFFAALFNGTGARGAIWLPQAAFFQWCHWWFREPASAVFFSKQGPANHIFYPVCQAPIFLISPVHLERMIGASTGGVSDAVAPPHGRGTTRRWVRIQRWFSGANHVAQLMCRSRGGRCCLPHAGGGEPGPGGGEKSILDSRVTAMRMMEPYGLVQVQLLEQGMWHT